MLKGDVYTKDVAHPESASMSKSCRADLADSALS